MVATTQPVPHRKVRSRTKTKTRSRARPVRAVLRGLTAAFIVLVATPVASFLTMMAAFVYLPLPGTIPEPAPPALSQPSIVYDQHGDKIGEFRVFETNRPMEPSDISQVLKDAVVAAEDRRFYQHHGVDPEAIMRALVTDLRSGATSQGGSTITQQYVKNVFVGDDVTVVRKVREAVLAARVERNLSKDDILFRYLQASYFGEGAYGAAAAAETYFRKPLRDVTISEAATLAGIIPSPSRWNPRNDPINAERRRVQTLNAMLAEGFITYDQHQQAVNQPIWLTVNGPAPGPSTLVHPQPTFTSPNPYFLDYVRRWVEERYGDDLVYRGGLKIFSTLDREMQAAAEAELARVLNSNPPELEMSLVSLEPGTGFVRALVGGRDYNAPGGQVNLALGQAGGGSGRQPGSAFKPFVLAQAFQAGINPNAVYSGAPQPLPDGSSVSNYGGAVYGNLTLTQATVMSANTPFTRLIEQVGVANTMNTARAVGVTSVPDYHEGTHGVSVALGALDVSPLDMASGYGTFAARGMYHAPSPVSLVTTSDDQVVENLTELPGTRVLDQNVADNINQILTGVLHEGGTAAGKALNRPAAGKTGTTTNNHDAWFVGYTPSLSTSVWIGYRDSQNPLRGINGVGSVTGGTIPALTWQRYMTAALQNVPPSGFAEPAPILPRVSETTTTTRGWEPGVTPTTEPLTTPTYIAPFDIYVPEPEMPRD